MDELHAELLPEPSLTELLDVVETTEAYELGLKLGIDEHDLNAIKKNHPSDIKKQLLEVLKSYLHQTERPSWQQVAVALQGIKEVKVAANIANRYGFTLPEKQRSALPLSPFSNSSPAPTFNTNQAPHHPMGVPASNHFWPQLAHHQPSTDEQRMSGLTLERVNMLHDTSTHPGLLPVQNPPPNAGTNPFPHYTPGPSMPLTYQGSFNQYPPPAPHQSWEPQFGSPPQQNIPSLQYNPRGTGSILGFSSPTSPRSFTSLSPPTLMLGLEETLENANNNELHTKFNQLRIFTSSQLEKKNVSPQKFHQFAVGMFFQASQCIPKTADICTMFNSITLNRLWDCLNWGPLKSIIKEFLPGEKEVEDKVHEYQQILAAYRATTKIVDFIKSKPGLLAVDDEEPGLREDEEEPPRKRARYDRSYYRPLRVKLKVNPSDVMVSYITEIWEALSIQFLLPSFPVFLERVEVNSISITWLIPTSEQEHIKKQSSFSEEFFQSHKIIEVYVDDECVYPFTQKFSTKYSGNDDDFGPSSSPKQAEDSSGYDCEFLEQTSPVFQTSCPICLKIFRNPHELTCCGTVFCFGCISRVQAKSMECPCCKRKELEMHRNKSLDRALKQLHVRCQNHEHGCTWTGELGQYDRHLNLKMQLKERMDGCKFADLPCCNNCGEYIIRRNILVHEMNECPKKRDDHSTMEKSLFFHMQSLEIELNQYQKSKPRAKYEGKQHSLEIENEIPLPDTELDTLTNKVSADHDMHATVLPEEICAEESATVIPVQRTLQNFSTLKESSRDFVSEPFFTHPNGYKMCLWVFPNGYGSAENKYLSMFTCFLKGNDDKKLSWPFYGNITVHLVDQNQNHNHRERVIRYDKENNRYAKRVTMGDKSKGWGASDLISHETLQKESCPYLKNDCLKFQVTKVELKKHKFWQR